MVVDADQSVLQLHLDSPSRDFARIGRLELVQPHRVAVQELLSLFLRHAFHCAVHELPRLGVGRRRVREIGFPHDVVETNLVSNVPSQIEFKMRMGRGD